MGRADVAAEAKRKFHGARLLLGLAALLAVVASGCSGGGNGPYASSTVAETPTPEPLATLGYSTPTLSATTFERVTDTAAFELTPEQIDGLEEACKQAAGVPGSVTRCVLFSESRSINLVSLAVSSA